MRIKIKYFNNNTKEKRRRKKRKEKFSHTAASNPGPFASKSRVVPVRHQNT